jgi:hypothetical protein
MVGYAEPFQTVGPQQPQAEGSRNGSEFHVGAQIDSDRVVNWVGATLTMVSLDIQEFVGQ